MLKQYDLTPLVAANLHRHLAFPLLDFVAEHKVYTETDVLKTRLKLLSSSLLVDFHQETAEKLWLAEGNSAETFTPSPELAEQRKYIVEQRSKFSECESLVKLIQDTALVKQLRADKNFNYQFLNENYGITLEQIEKSYEWARFLFEMTDYSAASEILLNYRLLSQNMSPERVFASLWGKLACEILQRHWQKAVDDVARLREAIDSRNLTAPFALMQRTWLLHWSLFVLFNWHDARDDLTDLFFHERYLQAVQLNCPYLLRYMIVAVVANPRRHGLIEQLMAVLRQETPAAFRDPITDFLECLYISFDFDGAQSKLARCTDVLRGDFFLVSWLGDFVENARLLIFETYCRVHQCIDISMLAQKLNMEQEQAEAWIVNMIRNARLDAKIDSQANRILMGIKTPTVYQQVIDKTVGMSFRSQVLISNLERRQQE